MKQTTKNILGVGAIILLSSGVAGLTTYKLLQSNESAKETSFNEMFKQNPNVKLAAFDAVNAQPVDLTQAAENSDIMPLGHTAPGLVVPKLVVPTKGATQSAGSCARSGAQKTAAASAAVKSVRRSIVREYCFPW